MVCPLGVFDRLFCWKGTRPLMIWEGVIFDRLKPWKNPVDDSYGDRAKRLTFVPFSFSGWRVSIVKNGAF